MTIVDDTGEVVAMTTSVESVFGANIMTKGFMLNNTLTDFSFQPTREGKPVANAPAPGKLPLSAMSPTIVFDNKGTFLASVGLRILAETHERAGGTGKFAVVATGPATARPIQLTKLDEFLALYQSAEEALGALGG
jgi:hypothetical protein